MRTIAAFMQLALGLVVMLVEIPRGLKGSKQKVKPESPPEIPLTPPTPKSKGK